MPVSHQQAAGQNARRIVSRASRGAADMGVADKVLFDVTATRNADQSDNRSLVSVMDAIAFINRQVDIAMENDQTLAFTIRPTLPAFHVTHDSVWTDR